MKKAKAHFKDLLEYLLGVTEDKRNVHECLLSCDIDSLWNYAFGIVGEDMLWTYP
jgi:hypothetical protein